NRSERRLLAFVLSRGRAPALVALGPVAPVEKALSAWRRGVASVTPVADQARRLRLLVWEPLRAHLAGARTVLVAPDGVLCGLLFAALPGSKPGRYLLEEVTVGYVPSARQLVLPDRQGRSGGGLLVLGGVDYGKPRAGVPVAELPGTGLEARRVAGL